MDKRHFYHNINAATDFNYFKDTFPKVCVRPACMCKIISGADLSDIDQAMFFLYEGLKCLTMYSVH